MNDKTDFKGNNLLIELRQFPTRKIVLRLEDDYCIDSTTVDLSVFPFLVESLISRGANSIALKSPIKISSIFMEDIMGKSFVNRITIPQNIKLGMKKTQAYLNPVYFELNAFFDGSTIHYTALPNLEHSIYSSLGSLSRFLVNFFIGMDDDLMINEDINKIQMHIKHLLECLKKPESRLKLAQLRGLLLAYKKDKVESLILKPKGSKEIIDIFNQIVSEDIYQEMSMTLKDSKRITLRDKSFLQYSKLSRQIAKMKKYKGIFKIGYKIFTSFIPGPNIQDFQDLMKKKDLPTISKLSDEIEIAIKNWHLVNPKATPIMFTDDIEGVKIKEIYSGNIEPDNSTPVRAIVESPMDHYQTVEVQVASFTGSRDGSSTTINFL